MILDAATKQFNGASHQSSNGECHPQPRCREGMCAEAREDSKVFEHRLEGTRHKAVCDGGADSRASNKNAGHQVREYEARLAPRDRQGCHPENDCGERKYEPEDVGGNGPLGDGAVSTQRLVLDARDQLRHF